MLESLVNPKRGEKRPWSLFFVGLLYASISIFLANWLFAGNPVFSKHISIIVVFFTVMFSIPFMYYTIRLEEEKDTHLWEESRLLKEHSKALLAFICLFLGITVAFSVFYTLYPASSSQNFQIQIETYCQINSYSEKEFNSCIERNNVAVGKANFAVKDLQAIFLNNFNVMLLAILFSFFFGAGAIFILTWNASVIGAAIGIFAKGFSGLPAGFLRFLVHGVPEILAYFVAGLAGGIISVAVVRHDFRAAKFNRILKDALSLILLAIAVLIVAALMEVFITPAFFG